MSNFDRFREQTFHTADGSPITDEEAHRLYYRRRSGKSPEQIAELKQRFKHKMARRNLRERIARWLFRLGN